MLRQIEKDGGNDRKSAYKIEVDAIYNCYERESILPAPLLLLKGKDKARLQAIRITRLGPDSPEHDAISDIDRDSEELDVFETVGRDSITNWQLKEKRACDKRLPREEYNRKQLFSLHKCTRDGCENSKGAYYYIEAKDSYYKVTSPELDE